MTHLSVFAAQLPGLSVVDAGGALELARASWPQLQFEPTRFGQYLAARVGDDVKGRHLADLSLAWATLDGQPAALEAFDRLFISWTTAALRARPAGVELAEVQSRLRVRLLVSTPALAQYTGKGALKAFVIVAALRTLTDLARQSTAARDVDTLELAEVMLDPEYSPQAGVERAQLRPRVREALERSVTALPVRLRMVLRLHYLEGVPAEALARMYGVHRATTTRWLQEARQRVLEATQAHLADVLGPETFSSVKRELGDFELSLAGLFVGSSEGAP